MGATFYFGTVSVSKSDCMNIPSVRCLLMGLFVFASLAPIAAQSPLQKVNAVLGDESFLTVFGEQPDETVNEVFRIQLHLAYVEEQLRSKNVSELNPTQQQNRARLLDLLHAYWTAGVFPHNTQYPLERRPCFIDQEGRLCAVGFLLAMTEGIDAANDINSRNQYAYVMDMNEPALLQWAEEYGLTVEECAMIQPTYGPPPPTQTSYAELKTGYAVPSAIISGGNLALSIAQLSRHANHRSWAYAGLVSGGGQLIWGLANIRKSQFTAGINGTSSYTRYRAQNNLSYLNIALGTATMVTSSLQLAMRKKKGSDGLPVSVYGYPNESNSLTLGVYYSYRF